MGVIAIVHILRLFKKNEKKVCFPNSFGIIQNKVILGVVKEPKDEQEQTAFILIFTDTMVFKWKPFVHIWEAT